MFPDYCTVTIVVRKTHTHTVAPPSCIVFTACDYTRGSGETGTIALLTCAGPDVRDGVVQQTYKAELFATAIVEDIYGLRTTPAWRRQEDEC